MNNKTNKPKKYTHKLKKKEAQTVMNMNVHPSSLSPVIVGGFKRPTKPIAKNIQYDVRTGKPFPNQFTRDGKRITNTIVKKHDPKISCPVWEFAPAASSKRWYGSNTLPNSNITVVLNPDIGFASPGFNESMVSDTGGVHENCVVTYANFSPMATLRDPTVQ